MRHITQFGLGLCLLGRERGRDHHAFPSEAEKDACRALGLLGDTIACDGTSVGVSRYLSDHEPSFGTTGDVWVTRLAPVRLPGCPRCSVLRESALQGVLLVGTPPAPPETRTGASTPRPEEETA